MSYQHWMASTRIPDEVKLSIKSIYYDENRTEIGAEEIWKRICALEVGRCQICDYVLTVGSPTCPNMLPPWNRLPENPTDGQLLHFKKLCENMMAGVRKSMAQILRDECEQKETCEAAHFDQKPNVFRGARCMHRFNNSLEMVESSRQVGLKTGPANIQKAHEKDGMRFCETCSMETMHIVGVGCMRCHNNTKAMRESTTRRNLENWKDPVFAARIAANLGPYLVLGVAKKWCEACKSETYHIGERCLVCCPNENFRPNGPHPLLAPLYDMNGKRYWKGQPLEEFLRELETKESKLWPDGFSKISDGHWTWYGVDLHDKPNFDLQCGYFVHYGPITLYYDRKVADFVPWEEYKRRFVDTSVQLGEKWDKTAERYGFVTMPTFRTQESNDWSGGAKKAFEQSLVDENVGWFVYVKFATGHDGTTFPLVVGKSGSLLVNITVSDLSFSTDPDDGPARLFLSEMGLVWLKTHVSILKCESETEAYALENEIMNALGLFGS